MQQSDWLISELSQSCQKRGYRATAAVNDIKLNFNTWDGFVVDKKSAKTKGAGETETCDIHFMKNNSY